MDWFLPKSKFDFYFLFFASLTVTTVQFLNVYFMLLLLWLQSKQVKLSIHLVVTICCELTFFFCLFFLSGSSCQDGPTGSYQSHGSYRGKSEGHFVWHSPCHCWCPCPASDLLTFHGYNTCINRSSRDWCPDSKSIHTNVSIGIVFVYVLYLSCHRVANDI